MFIYKHFKITVQISSYAEVNHLRSTELHEKKNRFQFKKICLHFMKIDILCRYDISFGLMQLSKRSKHYQFNVTEGNHCFTLTI